ncbi:MAG: PepSY domain-containing protein, partial [Gemmataceae bacterium]|nr:PepSY domain-containing protein [Gemmataceae bacterium]
MSLAPEPTLTSPLAETEPAALQAQPTPVPKPSGGLYRVIWRWHFYAGLLVAPVLFTVALTGSLYVFREELEPLLYPGLTVDTPQEKRVSYQAQLDVAVAACPDGKPDSLDIDRDPRRSTIVWMEGEGDRWRLVHVSPYTGAVLGQQQHETGFFSVVLAIHRQLFLGTTGRIVVELTTCWTILLLVTGLYLWLPRKREKLWGVLLPRLRAKPYTVLRDLHAVPGFSLAVVALLIAGTWLYWTFCWGQG